MKRLLFAALLLGCAPPPPGIDCQHFLSLHKRYCIDAREAADFCGTYRDDYEQLAAGKKPVVELTHEAREDLCGIEAKFIEGLAR